MKNIKLSVLLVLALASLPAQSSTKSVMGGGESGYTTTIIEGIVD